MVSTRSMSVGDGRKEPGFVFPVDAPECCQHYVSRRRKGKTRDENQALYLTRGQLPAGHTERTNYSTGCRPVETKTGTMHKIQIKVRCRLANEQINTQKTQSKTKSYKNEGVRACVCSLNRVEREMPCGFGSSSLLLLCFPYSPCCFARPGSKETVLPVVDSASQNDRGVN